MAARPNIRPYHVAHMSMASVPTSPPAQADIGFDDRLLAEAVRAWESMHTTPLDDARALRHAAAGAGTLEQRIVRRAALLSIADALRRSLQAAGRVISIAIMIAAILGAVGGAGAARAALAIGRDDTTNVFAALLVLLGLQSLLFVIWLGCVIVRPATLRSGSLGGVVANVTGWLARRLNRQPTSMAVVSAMTDVYSRGRIGVWFASAVSHGLWAAFNVGAVAALLVLLSTRQYTFTWETTILSADAYTTLTTGLGAGPRAIGLPVPDGEQIARAQWPLDSNPPPGSSERQAWAGWLIGCVMLYGFLPRMALLAGAHWRWRINRTRYRLPLNESAYLRLRDRLNVDHRLTGRADADAPADADGAPVDGMSNSDDEVSPPHARPPGPPAFVGLELPDQRVPELPDIHSPWQNLGMIDSGEDCRRIARRLASMELEPSPLLIIVSLSNTPDRGVATMLRALGRSVRAQPRLLLTGGHATRTRSNSRALDQRIADWRTTAGEAGLDATSVRAVDLDHLTDESRRLLRDWLDSTVAAASTTEGGSDERTADGPGSSRKLEAAFDVVLRHVRTWREPPKTEAQTAMMREIAGLYAADRAPTRLLTSLGLTAPGSAADVEHMLGRAAERVQGLLPPSLTAHARWVAAGATAGAIGCLATAMLVWPGVAAALPAWSTVGAAIAGLHRMSRTSRDTAPDNEEADDEANEADLAEPIRAAALYAVLLELQGRDEATISSTIDATFTPVPLTPLDSVPSVQRWLDDVRHHFDIALSETSADAGSTSRDAGADA